MHPILLTCCLLPCLASIVSGQVQEVLSPAPIGSGEPNLVVTPDGRLLLSWIEEIGEKHALCYATGENDGWSDPTVVVSGENWFVNWADFPSLVGLPDGSLAAHWLVKSGKDTYDYDVHIARSSDGGKTWGKSFTPHRDGVKAEHGFVSMFANDRDVLSVAWLDGREMKAGGHGHGRGNMTLRYVEVQSDGQLRGAALLDERVCECCQTSAVMTNKGPVVVYRDRSHDEVRDIAMVRRVDGKWLKPQLVHPDGWKIAGCPVNGPSIAASGDNVAVAWFTAARDRACVQVAISRDSGATFAAPLRLDEANPIGRAKVRVHTDGSVFVCWLARDDKVGAVRMCRLDERTELGDVVTIARTGVSRRNGFPQMVICGDALVFAWTDGRVQTARLPIK